MAEFPIEAIPDLLASEKYSATLKLKNDPEVKGAKEDTLTEIDVYEKD